MKKIIIGFLIFTNLFLGQAFFMEHGEAAVMPGPGHYALACACVEGDLPEVIRLIEVEGVSVNSRNTAGFTPLHWAAMHRHQDLMQYLIDNCAERTAEAFVGGNGITPAILASLQRDPGLLALFVDDLRPLPPPTVLRRATAIYLSWFIPGDDNVVIRPSEEAVVDSGRGELYGVIDFILGQEVDDSSNYEDEEQGI